MMEAGYGDGWVIKVTSKPSESRLAIGVLGNFVEIET